MEFTYCVLRTSQTNNPFAIVGVAEDCDDVHITFLKDTSVSFIVACKPLYQLKQVKQSLEDNGVEILPNGEFKYDYTYDASIGKSQLPAESIHNIFELYKFQCNVFLRNTDNYKLLVKHSMGVFYLDTIAEAIGASDNIDVISTGCGEVEIHTVQAILEKAHELNVKVNFYIGIISAIAALAGVGSVCSLVKLILH